MVKEDMQEVGARDDEVGGRSVCRKPKKKTLTRKTSPTPSQVLDQERI